MRKFLKECFFMAQTRHELGAKLARIGQQLIDFAREIAGDAEGATKAEVRTAEELQSLVDRGLCVSCKKKLNPGQTPRRSMHPACYKRTLEEIDEGLTTWAELEQANLVPRKQPGGRKPEFSGSLAGEIQKSKGQQSAKEEGKATAQDLTTEENAAAGKKSGKNSGRKKRG